MLCLFKTVRFCQTWILSFALVLIFKETVLEFTLITVFGLPLAFSAQLTSPQYWPCVSQHLTL